MFENRPKFGPEHFKAGADIIQQGDEPEKFYIILHGQVEVVSQPPNSLDKVIGTLGPGDYFGEVGMVLQTQRTATVRALTNVDVMAMDYDTFQNWIESWPMVAEEINSLISERMPEADALDLLELIKANIDQTETHQADKTIVDGSERYAEGEIIIQQDDPADKFYVVTEGFVTVSHKTEEGREITIAYLTEGDYFGEIGLLEGLPRIATVTALTDVKVVSFDRDTFRRWMYRSPNSRSEIQQTAKKRLYDTGQLTLPKNFTPPDSDSAA